MVQIFSTFFINISKLIDGKKICYVFNIDRWHLTPITSHMRLAIKFVRTILTLFIVIGKTMTCNQDHIRYKGDILSAYFYDAEFFALYGIQPYPQMMAFGGLSL